MTLCIDALGPRPGGIGRYTWELCQRLPALSDLDVRFFGRGRLIDDPRILLRDAPLPRRRRGLRKIGAWWDSRLLSNGLVHGPNYFLPDFANHGVVTIHDLSVIKYPETHPAERVAQFEQRFSGSLERASAIITDTETVRQELISEFGVAPERVTAIHLGVDRKFGPSAAAAGRTELLRLGLEAGRYALCVSTLEPRKKISELLTCWQQLPAKLRTAYPLVLVGGSGWRNEHLQSAIAEGQREGWLRYLGFLDEQAMPAVYAGARLFLYPSIYEGFGLPPLEAMASGTPAIVAARSCLPEVCGDAARYVDPADAEGMLKQIAESLPDDDWLRLAASKGLRRASEFTWDKCVDQTAALYRKVRPSAAAAG